MPAPAKRILCKGGGSCILELRQDVSENLALPPALKGEKMKDKSINICIFWITSQTMSRFGFFKYGDSRVEGVDAVGYSMLLGFFGISIGIETETY